jgi:hypothetical protein
MLNLGEPSCSAQRWGRIHVQGFRKKRRFVMKNFMGAPYVLSAWSAEPVM